MGRKKHSIWKYAEKLEDGFKCNFCHGEYGGGAGATRIVAHLAKESGNGIEICARVTQKAKAEAHLAFYSRKRARLALDGKESKSESTSTPESKAFSRASTINIQDAGQRNAIEQRLELGEVDFEDQESWAKSLDHVNP